MLNENLGYSKLESGCFFESHNRYHLTSNNLDPKQSCIYSEWYSCTVQILEFFWKIKRTHKAVPLSWYWEQLLLLGWTTSMHNILVYTRWCQVEVNVALTTVTNHLVQFSSDNWTEIYTRLINCVMYKFWFNHCLWKKLTAK